MTDTMSVVKLGKDEILNELSNGQKRFIKTKYGKKDCIVGGYHGYFKNLSRGRYKRDPNDAERGWGGPRTWKFILKHMAVADKILTADRPVKVLDIGCSSGFLRKVLESNTFGKEEIYYYGVDARENVLLSALMDENDIESGASGNNIQTVYVNHDVRAGLPFHDDAFDFVVSFEMAKYLEKSQTAELMKEISRVLKADGTLFFSSAGLHGSNDTDMIQKDRKTNFASVWDMDELQNALSAAGLSIAKVYGSEADYKALKSTVNGDDRPLFTKMDSLFPTELTAAVAGFFCPEATDVKLLVVKKAVDLEKELHALYAGKDIKCMGHIGNSKIFMVGNNVVKYLNNVGLGKHQYVHSVLLAHTRVRLPKLISSRESGVYNGVLIEMENLGKTVSQVWDGLNMQEKEHIVRKIAQMLKELHSVRFNPDTAPLSLRLLQASEMNFSGESSWKNEVKRFLERELAKEYNGKAQLHKRLNAVFKDNMDHVQDVDYRLVHHDINLDNIFLGENGELGLALDFETFFVGDPLFDVAAACAWINDGHLRSVLMDEYGKPPGFEDVAKIYRLIFVIVRLWITAPVPGCEENIADYVENGGSLNMKWLKKLQ